MAQQQPAAHAEQELQQSSRPVWVRQRLAAPKEQNSSSVAVRSQQEQDECKKEKEEEDSQRRRKQPFNSQGKGSFIRACFPRLTPLETRLEEEEALATSQGAAQQEEAMATEALATSQGAAQGDGDKCHIH